MLRKIINKRSLGTVKTAGQSDTLAQFNLGLLYAKGRRVPQDYPQAVDWFLKAANQELAVAQISLGCTRKVMACRKTISKPFSAHETLSNKATKRRK